MNYYIYQKLSLNEVVYGQRNLLKFYSVIGDLGHGQNRVLLAEDSFER